MKCKKSNSKYLHYKENTILNACFLTPSQSRVSQLWSGSVPALELVCRPRSWAAETEQAAQHQGKDAARAGGRSETETPGTDCALHCSGSKENTSILESTANTRSY